MKGLQERENALPMFLKGDPSVHTPTPSSNHQYDNMNGLIYQVSRSDLKIANVIILLMILCSFQASQGQSGIGIGLVYATPQSGGFSIRYKPIQILVDVSFTAGRSIDGGTQANFNVPGIALRYNYFMVNFQKINFNVYGQIGRRNPAVSVLPTRVLFTGGGSAEYQFGGNSSLRGLRLTLDLGLTIDNKGNLFGNPARGISLHYMF